MGTEFENRLLRNFIITDNQEGDNIELSATCKICGDHSDKIIVSISKSGGKKQINRALLEAEKSRRRWCILHWKQRHAN